MDLMLTCPKKKFIKNLMKIEQAINCQFENLLKS